MFKWSFAAAIVALSGYALLRAVTMPLYSGVAAKNPLPLGQGGNLQIEKTLYQDISQLTRDTINDRIRWIRLLERISVYLPLAVAFLSVGLLSFHSPQLPQEEPKKAPALAPPKTRRRALEVAIVLIGILAAISGAWALEAKANVETLFEAVEEFENESQEGATEPELAPTMQIVRTLRGYD